MGEISRKLLTIRIVSSTDFLPPMQSSSTRALARSAARAVKNLPTSRRQLATAVDVSRDPVEYDQVTTLPNGVRVATEALPGPFSGIGVYVDAGSRYENEELRGVSHIVDRLAFKVCLKK